MIVFLCFCESRLPSRRPDAALTFGRFYRARRGTARGADGERQQRDVAGPFDGHAEPALMARAYASHAARQDLPALLDELGEYVCALVVDQVDLLDAELAHFLLAEELTFAAARAA